MIGLAAGLIGLTTWARAQQPEFRAYEIATPGGKKIGVVDMNVGGRRSRIVEVVSSLPGWPVGKRAEAVADRLRKVQAADPTWWQRLGVGSAKKAVVVTVAGLKGVEIPRAADGSPYVITADPKFAREWGLSPAGLARQLVAGIKQTFQPRQVSLGRRGTDDGSGNSKAMTQEEKRATAIRMKQEGDDAYSQQDYENAEANYRDAIKMSPDYAVPYLRLAELYCSQGKMDEAKEVLKSVRALKNLTADDKAEISRIMSKVK
jgi:tetratricopeptide (TPR) repeat protein